MREHAGKTAPEAAALLAVDRARISNIESGRLGISEERIQRLATFYSCDDSAYVDALCAISREHRGQFWWDEYRGILAPGFLDVAELEYHATHLRVVQSITVPGPLQTEKYARALFAGAIPELPPDEVEARTEHRVRRRVIFERETPTPLEVIIHEAALRMRFGGSRVVREQLEHLLECTERPYVTLRVVPFTTETFFEVTQPVMLAGGPVPRLDTVQVDSYLGGRFLDADAELARYRKFFAVAEKVSLNSGKSRQLIHSITQEI